MSDTAREIYKLSYPNTTAPSVTENGNSVDGDSIEEEVSDLYKQKMKISTGMGLFLNFNAIVLLCTFILCYAIFA